MTTVTAERIESSAVQILSREGVFAPNEASVEYVSFVEKLSDAQLCGFYRDMALVRRFDAEAANLQRQGHLGLWVPSHGQEAAQVGSARAARVHDHIFPAYREHAVGMIRGIDPIGIIKLLRGVTHGGWNPNDPANGNFHLYTLVIGAQTLHATGYAMGLRLDGTVATGDSDTAQAVLVYFGDGATSQGDVSEALIFAASYQTPQVFFLQNNHWAISVPVSVQSRTPLYLRSAGFGVPSVQVDGNDVLASYAVTAKHLDDARSGRGPSFIEALTYRIGAHTSSDDPTKYRSDDELAYWVARDPLTRFETYLRGRGTADAFFSEIAEEGSDLAADIRHRAIELGTPSQDVIFDHVYTDPHPVTAAQKSWFSNYEASFEGDDR